MATNGIEKENAASLTPDLHSDFVEGDIDVPAEHLSLNIEDLNGKWEEIREISESKDAIFLKSGVGALKRRLLSKHLGLVEVAITNEQTAPVFHMKAYYPMAIIKESKFTADGVEFKQADSDTCDWTTKAIYQNGKLIQKRVGAKGVMYDSRCVVSQHPHSTESPLMVFEWTLIEPSGEKHVSRCWMKRLS